MDLLRNVIYFFLSIFWKGPEYSEDFEVYESMMSQSEEGDDTRGEDAEDEEEEEEEDEEKDQEEEDEQEVSSLSKCLNTFTTAVRQMIKKLITKNTKTGLDERHVLFIVCITPLYLKKKM